MIFFNYNFNPSRMALFLKGVKNFDENFPQNIKLVYSSVYQGLML